LPMLGKVSVTGASAFCDSGMPVRRGRSSGRVVPVHPKVGEPDVEQTILLPKAVRGA